MRPVAAASALLALALAGCSATGGSAEVEGPVTVYVSLSGSVSGAVADERDAADGVRLALLDAGGRAGELEVRLRFLDDYRRQGRLDLALIGANAREAASDSSAAAFIGELDSAPTRTSLPILNEAGIAQVSPGATALDLTTSAPGFDDVPERYRPSGEVTFVRVVPSDAVVDEVRRRTGERVTAQIAPARLPEAGAEARQRFEARFGRAPMPSFAYGYEAMAVVLQAIEERDPDEGSFRSAVAEALLKVKRFDESLLGPYSFTTEGDTTLCEVQVWASGPAGDGVPGPIECGAP